MNRDGHIDGADYLCAVSVERLDMLAVARDKIDIHARLCEICAEHGAERPCAVNCGFHRNPLFDKILSI